MTNREWIVRRVERSSVVTCSDPESRVIEPRTDHSEIGRITAPNRDEATRLAAERYPDIEIDIARSR